MIGVAHQHADEVVDEMHSVHPHAKSGLESGGDATKDGGDLDQIHVAGGGGKYHDLELIGKQKEWKQALDLGG